MEAREKRTIYLLGITSMINDTSSEAIYTLLPFYIDNPVLIGFFGGLFNGLGNIFKIIFGYLSDKTGKRKPFVILGYALSAIAKTLISLISIIFLPLLIILDRIGKGVRNSPRDAILASIKERGYAFGIHRAFDTAGALLGTILAYIMVITLKNYKTAILIAGLLSFLSIPPLLFIYDPKIKRKSFALLRFSPKMKKFILPMILFGFSFVSPMIFINESKKVFKASAILLYTIYNIFYIFSSIYFGKKSDLYGRRKIMSIGGIATAFSFIFMFLASTSNLKHLFVLFFTLYGIGIGAFIPSAFAYIGDISEFKGTALGIFQCIYGISVLVSSTIFGIILSEAGPIAYLIYSLIPIFALLSLQINSQKLI